MRARIAWVRAAVTVAAVVGLDQLTKRLIADRIDVGDTRNVLPGLQFTHTRNHGVAFGLGSGDDTIVLVFVGVALIGVLVYFARHTSRSLAWLPTGLLIGGALGNIIDRARDGSVTDFIKLPLGWPPFNVADMAITFGVLSLFYVLEDGGRENDENAPADDERPLAAPAPGRGE